MNLDKIPKDLSPNLLSLLPLESLNLPLPKTEVDLQLLDQMAKLEQELVTKVDFTKMDTDRDLRRKMVEAAMGVLNQNKTIVEEEIQKVKKQTQVKQREYLERMQGESREDEEVKQTRLDTRKYFELQDKISKFEENKEFQNKKDESMLSEKLRGIED